MVDINITTNSILLAIPKETGETSDGQIIYETKYSQTGKVKNFTIPEENKDKFEKVIQEVHKKYGKYNIDPEKKFTKAAHLATLGGAIIGGALTASLIKTKSKMGKFTKTLGGALGGVVVATLALTGAIVYPITKYTRELKKLGFKPLEMPPQETAKTNDPKTEEKELAKTEKE